MAEYEYCNEWAYLASEAGHDDPRVLVSVGEDEWALQARSISEFFVLLAAVRLPSHFGWSVQLIDDDFPDGAAPRERIEAAYCPMGFQNWRELGADSALFGGPDVIVRHDTGMADFSVEISGRTREALAAAAGTLGWTWDEAAVEPPNKDAEP
ncbi:hypothetical protein F8568_029865 [Actinomadura sp. LD22]|uniref:Uncharacterized protein n=1 Tax=Actinomadura physcomitrii TaxID=2650748 RepID=A0A6I4MFI7_9ACTN|nr:hypothetical protein [Actinomadura physcomitrii]MWA04512.1 hypothetical protein [Actinomadura physcomitrii]